MSKTHIYCMPGLAAGPEIFYNLSFDLDLYEVHYLSWKKPLALEESLANYAMRMCEEIKHKNAILIGVSFGGILVQEMSKFVETEKIIIISSVKSKFELSKRYKIASKSGIHKLFPTRFVSNFEFYAKFFIGKSLTKKANFYKKYLSIRSKTYLKWSIHNAVNWDQEEPIEGIIHIHGTKDTVFPVENIKNAILIEGGNHAMVITKAKKITKIIHENLT